MVAAQEAAAPKANGAGPAAAGEPPAGGFKGKKSKAAAKQGKGKTQWEILKQSGIPEEEIPAFRCARTGVQSTGASGYHSLYMHGD